MNGLMGKAASTLAGGRRFALRFLTPPLHAIAAAFHGLLQSFIGACEQGGRRIVKICQAHAERHADGWQGIATGQYDRGLAEGSPQPFCSYAAISQSGARQENGDTHWEPARR